MPRERVHHGTMWKREFHPATEDHGSYTSFDATEGPADADEMNNPHLESRQRVGKDINDTP